MNKLKVGDVVVASSMGRILSTFKITVVSLCSAVGENDNGDTAIFSDEVAEDGSVTCIVSRYNTITSVEYSYLDADTEEKLVYKKCLNELQSEVNALSEYVKEAIGNNRIRSTPMEVNVFKDVIKGLRLEIEKHI